MILSRKKLGEVAKEIADHLQLIEQVKALQTGQKEIAEPVAALGDRIRKLENDMIALKAETKLDAIREAQQVVYAVQGGLNDRIQELAVRVALSVREAPKLSDSGD